MDIFLMLVTSVLTGVAVTLISRREGLGSWIGDQIWAVFGAGLGTYVISTLNMNKSLDTYLFWIVVFSGAGALATLTLSNLLLGDEEEEAAPLRAQTAFLRLERYDTEEQEPYTLPRAA